MLKARHTADSNVEVGVDEAGRGCLWGPLFAAAVIWPNEEDWSDELRKVSGQIKDSKKVTPKRRGILESAIKQYAIAWNVGRVEAAEIDQLGMTKSNRLAFQRAIDGLSLRPDRILIDGTLGLTEAVLAGREQIVEPQGDGTYLSIAAASILAKEGRDRIVREMCDTEPSLQEKYGLLSSKGYGTAKHQAAIKTHGMHTEHRRLFLRKLLGFDHTVSTGYEFLDEN